MEADPGTQHANVIRLNIVLEILRSVFMGVDLDERMQVMTTIEKWIRENSRGGSTFTASATGAPGTWKGD